ncbi:rho GTPase-activating protein 22-like isoform X1 [Polyodon spathula]|uniref:rho GTPase-activating protein 22-like isoform X1 n=1 Tax=Polyodon spathula TaxID=7913 RepID=UPI001B7E2E79|nr:rho GTPase-activating protein 22-like isoform X1 [Polyodon spathula]
MLSPKIKQTRRARSKSMVMGQMSRSSNRPASPGLQEHAVKAGWLKKQRSIMKNWQLRWFVLRTDQLYFYKDEEETKPQGCIPLQGSQVNELLANPEESGKHVFEIVSGGAGERDRAAINHEAFLLMANSQNDMEDWVKAIRRVIWAPFGGGIFGQRLEDTVQYEKKFGQRLAPLMVEQCVDFIRERGLDEEGLFRMPGQANLVKEMQDAFDCGDKPLFDSNTDVHTVASLLKLYLRELPEPVIPFAKYEDFLSCAQLLAKDEAEGIQELVNQVKNLPQANYNLLKYICKFLDEVQSHSNENKMSVQNLATVFGPNILRPKFEDPVTIMEGTSLVQHLMTVLISEHERLLISTETDATVAQQEGRPLFQHNMVEWISEEYLQGIQSKNKSVNQPDDLCSSATSLDVNISTPVMVSKVASQGKGATQSQAATSPSKQMKSLPTWKCSFKSSGGRSSSVKLGGSSVDIPNLSSSGNWLINGLSSLRGHRRTSSGDRLKDSGSPQRLSTYDNVTASSLSVPTVASTTWSTSSCEISVQDSVSSCPACNASDSSGQICGKAEWSTQASQGHSDIKTSELENSSEGLEVCVSSMSCSEHSNMVTESNDSPICSKVLTSLVTELREELGKQKVEYETRIRRLEESSAELHVQVNRLEEELDQEKKKYAMLEIKLRNSDRAREDAEKRNQLLQKEMEDFFATLGDLTLRTRTTNI